MTFKTYSRESIQFGIENFGGLYATLLPYNDNPDKHFYHITDLFINKDKRRQGAATALMNAVVEKFGKTHDLCLAAGSYGDGELTLEESINFYSKFGFEMHKEPNLMKRIAL